jgi:hypothetical protein
MDKRNQLVQHICDTCPSTDYHLAKLIHMIYSDNYCITRDGNKDKWFKWNGSHWETSASITHELKIKLSEELSPLFSEARNLLRKSLDKYVQSWGSNAMKQLIKTEHMLYNTNTKDRILKECESLFFVNELPSR